MSFFSVIIPSFNRRDKVRNAIRSVLEQSDNDFEIILIDDGSDDGTANIVDEFENKITYIFQKNSGVSSARNKGIINSSAPHITFLDSDDIWHRDKLSSHKKFIENNPKILIHQTEDIWIRNGVRVNPKFKHIKPQGEIFIPSLDLCLISPSSVCISRTIFEKYGMFDEKLPACEDYDLWLRITPFEKTGLINEKLITRYSGHEDQLSSIHWGMDRFRLYSILKILHLYGDSLNTTYTEAAINTAIKKCEILLNGAAKRGNEKQSINLSQIITQLKDGSYMQADYQSLLGK
ncbi:MAG: glycosyltransferase [Spirochaetes bacterium]|nr:glycosyltransferase [Spirochaetota bacterium]